jgi:hypothetical protein
VAEPHWSSRAPLDSQQGAEPRSRHADTSVPLQLHQDARQDVRGAAEPKGYLRRSRAVRLLEAVISTKVVSPATVAAALVVRPDELAEYRTGQTRMPLEQQLSLALLVLERSPELSRQARTLRAQVAAETAFHAKTTATHMVAPPKLWR